MFKISETYGMSYIHLNFLSKPPLFDFYCLYFHTYFIIALSIISFATDIKVKPLFIQTYNYVNTKTYLI